MTKPFDANTVIESYREALEPAVRAQQEGLKVLERVARYQFGVVGDLLEWSLSATKSGFAAKTLADLTREQQTLGTQLNEQLRKRATELTQIATEVRGTVGSWIEEATAKVNAVTQKAA